MKHLWTKSNLGHGEAMCVRCYMTNREAWILGPECTGPFDAYELWDMDQEIIGYPFIPYSYLKIV